MILVKAIYLTMDYGDVASVTIIKFQADIHYNNAILRDLITETSLVILLKLDPNHSIQLCATFYGQLWIQTGVMICNCPNWGKTYFDLCDLDLWLLTLTVCMDITFINGNYSWNFMMIRWEEYCQKCVTEGRTEGLTVWQMGRAVPNGWVNNCETGDLRCHHAHYDVTVMSCFYFLLDAHSGLMTPHVNIYVVPRKFR